MGDDNSQKAASDCYVFKSRLQEYAQKVGVSTPVYHTVKEGPSHEPIFMSTVIVNGLKYESLPGFFNRKAAEQSAAEVALLELEKTGKTTGCMPTIHETGLCKNLLQEYAQKMNYAIPSYSSTVQTSGQLPFSCTVEIGGIQYVGAAARTKKEAEIKAARTALLVINSSSWARGTNGVPQYTVLPGKKKVKESSAPVPAATKKVKPRRAEFKKKWLKKRFPQKNASCSKPDKNDERETIGDGPGAESPVKVVDFSTTGESNLSCLVNGESLHGSPTETDARSQNGEGQSGGDLSKEDYPVRDGALTNFTSPDGGDNH